MSLRHFLPLLLIGVLVVASTGGAAAQNEHPSLPAAPDALAGTSFTYQGELRNGSSPVTATCDFQFSLHDALTAGAQLGSTQALTATVASGRFTVLLNSAGEFGPRAFDGSARWLAIAVKCPTGVGSYTPLAPRQALTPAPLALALPGLRTEQNATSPNVIGGHISNTVSVGVVGATIGGGGALGINANSVSADYATVGGGTSNTATGIGATVGGGGRFASTSNGNDATGAASTIGGGFGNTASFTGTVVGGGFTNTAGAEYATVGGGDNNSAIGVEATVGGGDNNTASGIGATVGGGGDNAADDTGATVAGGNGNVAGGEGASVGGGVANTVEAGATYGTIGGGLANYVSGQAATVGGGGWDGTNYNGNDATGTASTIGGGFGNTAADIGVFVGGGYSNTASADYASLSGGYSNTVSADYATVGGGNRNAATGQYAIIPGGILNVASGRASFAGGAVAHAVHESAFVWSCWACFDTYSSADNQFIVQAAGGFWIGNGSSSGPSGAIAAGQLISTTTGAYLSMTGVWTDVSDRNAKTAFAPVDGPNLLDALMGLPIESWTYKLEDAHVRHIGPTAQDFHAAFGVGSDDTHLAALDTSGVALAAVQQAYAVVQEQDARITALETRLAAVEAGPGTAQPGATPTLALPWLLLGGLGLLNLGGLAGYALARRKRG